MEPKDHNIQICVPEVEVCIDTSTMWDPDAEAYARPSDDVVERSVGDLIERHYEELVALCADRYVRGCEEMLAVVQEDCNDTGCYHEGRKYG